MLFAIRVSFHQGIELPEYPPVVPYIGEIHRCEPVIRKTVAGYHRLRKSVADFKISGHTEKGKLDVTHHSNEVVDVLATDQNMILEVETGLFQFVLRHIRSGNQRCSRSTAAVIDFDIPLFFYLCHKITECNLSHHVTDMVGRKYLFVLFAVESKFGVNITEKILLWVFLKSQHSVGEELREKLPLDRKSVV